MCIFLFVSLAFVLVSERRTLQCTIPWSIIIYPIQSLQRPSRFVQSCCTRGILCVHAKVAVPFPFAQPVCCMLSYTVCMYYVCKECHFWFFSWRFLRTEWRTQEYDLVSTTNPPSSVSACLLLPLSFNFPSILSDHGSKQARQIRAICHVPPSSHEKRWHHH